MAGSRIKFWRYIFLTPFLGAFGCGILWALGFASFMITIMVMTPPRVMSHVDGIVVLTGGEDRVATGFDLLAHGIGDELLISGVHTSVTLPDLLRLAPPIPASFACCITLGFQALDTAGNAVETAAWVKNKHINDILLVTASYHMPRAAVEMRRQMPNLRIIPYPVQPSGFDPWTRSGVIHVVKEYHKTLLALMRLGADKIRYLFMNNP